MWGSAAGISASRTTVLATGGQGVGASLAFVPLPEPVLAIAATVSDKAHVDLYRVRNDGRLGERHRISIGSPGIVGRNFTETDFGSSMSASGDLLVIGAFGQAVSVLDDRVAIGVPSEQLGVHETAGAIQLLRVERTGHGLRIHPGRLLTQARAGVPGDIGDIHVLGEEVLVTKLCAQGYGAISADYRDERLLSVPFIAGTCSSGWLSAEHKPGPPAVSILRRFVDGVAVDEPVIVVDDYTLQIGRPGSLTQTDLKGKVPAPVRLLAPPAA
jgi:hypothetical protein